MKKLTVLILTITMVLSVYGIVNATVLTFDDIATDTATAMPNGYGGFIWEDTYVANSTWDQISATGYNNGTVSSDNVAGIRFGSISLVDGGTFDFDGAYLTSAWYDNNVVTIVGYQNGGIVGDPVMVTVDTDSPTWFDFSSSFNGIDALILNTSNWHLAMDNFTFDSTGSTDSGAAPCPEPATMLLLGSGLAGLVGVSRKKLAKK